MHKNTHKLGINDQNITVKHSNLELESRGQEYIFENKLNKLHLNFSKPPFCSG